MVSSETAVLGPKMCGSGCKIHEYEKMTKTNKIYSKILYYICFLSFFRNIKFYDLIYTVLDLKQLFMRIPLNFTYEVIIFTLFNIGTQKSQRSAGRIASYKFDQYTAFQWPLWPLNLKYFSHFPFPNDPNKRKK